MAEGNSGGYDGILEMPESPLKKALLKAAETGHKLLEEAGHLPNTGAEIPVRVPVGNGSSEKFKTGGKVVKVKFGGR